MLRYGAELRIALAFLQAGEAPFPKSAAIESFEAEPQVGQPSRNNEKDPTLPRAIQHESGFLRTPRLSPSADIAAGHIVCRYRTIA